jgi:hypothetical protein
MIRYAIMIVCHRFEAPLSAALPLHVPVNVLTSDDRPEAPSSPTGPRVRVNTKHRVRGVRTSSSAQTECAPHVGQGRQAHQNSCSYEQRSSASRNWLKVNVLRCHPPSDDLRSVYRCKAVCVTLTTAPIEAAWLNMPRGEPQHRSLLDRAKDGGNLSGEDCTSACGRGDGL